MIAFGAVVHKVPRASFATEAIVHCNGLEQGRLARAVFAGEETDLRANYQLIKAIDGGDREWIALPILDPIAQEFDFLKHKKTR